MRLNPFNVISLLLAVSVTINSCSKLENDDPSDDTFFHCLYVYDALNNNPVYNAAVNMITVSPSGDTMAYPGTSDISGYCCVEIHTGQSIVGYEAGYFYYSPVYGSGAPSSVYITPEARLTLHVYNAPPTDINDVIQLSYNHPTLGDSLIQTITGGVVDTAISLYVTPGNNTVKLHMEHLGIGKDSILPTEYMWANHTVFVITY